jgi:hypothetical protein
MERVMGIEPTLAAWEAAVLPLNYTREVFQHYNERAIHGGVSRPNHPWLGVQIRCEHARKTRIFTH